MLGIQNYALAPSDRRSQKLSANIALSILCPCNFAGSVVANPVSSSSTVGSGCHQLFQTQKRSCFFDRWTVILQIFLWLEKNFKIVFVLGGPGSGKGTQCAKIAENYGFVHLSAGDLLRAEIDSGSENGTMIQNMIKEGKIVPAEVTVEVLQKAMSESNVKKFLLDDFPQNEEDRAIFEQVANFDPEFILFFHCSEHEMEKRLVHCNQEVRDLTYLGGQMGLLPLIGAPGPCITRRRGTGCPSSSVGSWCL
ncbi:hypothetical protein O6H91_17G080800 [Diphasiastrum complanatum]|uniref:Uncharacterized protein n=1 Tax=Diphasiastrum complanatum TaxID=34168 RepID=A0ACC2B8N6_DIPCM|nr:hypothetical protein O6H91_17G080800 [Diphasiastrum complanatum]